MISVRILFKIESAATKCHLYTTRYFSAKPPNNRFSSPPTPQKHIFAITAVSSFSLGVLTFFTFRKIFKKRPQSSVREEFKDKFCSGSSGSLVKVGQFWLPAEFFKERGKLEKIQQFDIREDDVIVASFPKSGTTWVQQIVSCVTSDPSKPRGDVNIEDRFPYLEYVYPGLSELDSRPSPRYLKTHLPLELLPEDILQGRGKVIYILRNPKDVAVSYWHFVRDLSVVRYTGAVSDFCHNFVHGTVAYGPWPDHVLQYWENRNSPNLLVITYEDLHQRPVETVRKMGKFLGQDLSEDRAQKIVRLCSFQQMKSDTSANYSWWHNLGLWRNKDNQFLRTGRVGDWRNYLPDTVSAEFETACLAPVREKGLHPQDSRSSS